jgi:hypothetical protein
MEAPDEEAMEIVRTRDSGTLQHEIFFNEDETEVVVFEATATPTVPFTGDVAPLNYPVFRGPATL